MHSDDVIAIDAAKERLRNDPERAASVLALASAIIETNRLSIDKFFVSDGNDYFNGKPFPLSRFGRRY